MLITGTLAVKYLCISWSIDQKSYLNSTGFIWLFYFRNFFPHCHRSVTFYAVFLKLYYFFYFSFFSQSSHGTTSVSCLGIPNEPLTLVQIRQARQQRRKKGLWKTALARVEAEIKGRSWGWRSIQGHQKGKKQKFEGQ